MLSRKTGRGAEPVAVDGAYRSADPRLPNTQLAALLWIHLPSVRPATDNAIKLSSPMTLPKPCMGADGLPCPTRALTTDRSGRCDHCWRHHWNARGTTTERGYGNDHRRLREHYRPLVEAGLVVCWRCGELIGADDAWDLGHSDTDRSVYRGPEHRAHNRATRKRH